MRRMMIVLVGLVAWMPAALALEIGVVNMERVIEEHPRTARDRAVLEQVIADFEVERDERLEALQALSEEFEALRQTASDISLTEETRQERMQRAQLKVEEMRRKETELREMVAERQRELRTQELRLRAGVIAEIRRVLETVAEKLELDMILDGGADPSGGYGAVLFTQDAHEVTDEVLLQIRAPSASDDE